MIEYRLRLYRPMKVQALKCLPKLNCRESQYQAVFPALVRQGLSFPIADGIHHESKDDNRGGSQDSDDWPQVEASSRRLLDDLGYFAVSDSACLTCLFAGDGKVVIGDRAQIALQLRAIFQRDTDARAVAFSYLLDRLPDNLFRVL